MTVISLGVRWRQAALEPYTDAPKTEEEWLRAIELAADAAVRVVLEHLRDFGEAEPKREADGAKLYASDLWMGVRREIDGLLS